MPFQDTIVVDVHEPMARNVVFRPLHRILEPEITSATKKQFHRRFYALGSNIPGDRFTVDFRNHTYKIANRLNLKENKALADSIRGAMAADEISPVKVGAFGDDEDGTFDSSDDATVTWLWHLRRLADIGHFKLISGKLPTCQEIEAMPGRVQTSFAGIMLPEKMADKACFLPEKAEKQLVGAK